MRRWTVLTPEYPPTRGGVSAYTFQLAEALVARGDHVDVWAPDAAPPSEPHGAQRNQLPDRFGPRSMKELGRALREREPSTILLQYVPQGFGMRGLNLPFLLWLARRPGSLWVMFHEVVYPFVRGQPLRRHALALGTRAMLGVLGSRADRVLVSIPGWIPYLERWARLKCEPEWAPVPSNLPPATAGARATVRARLGLSDEHELVGFFGRCTELSMAPLEPALEELLSRHPERKLLLIGQNSSEYAERWRSKGALSNRLAATGELEEQQAADHLAACDLALLPFLDGASSRRTSLMAALALGVPVVTTEGHLSEPLWRESGAVALAPAGDPRALVRRVDETLSNPSGGALLGRAGRRLYEEQFSLERAMSRLFPPA